MVKIAEIYTSNMTGFFACVLGASLTKASFIALAIMFPSAKADFDFSCI